MALDMKPEEKQVGQENFQRTVGRLGLDRRQFMQGLLAGGTVLPLAATAYFGYNNRQFHDRPVKTAVIGAGDEGGVLVGEHNPAFNEIVAICDIRPSNYNQRIWRGEARGPRKGLNYHYGINAKSRIRHVTDYTELLDPNKNPIARDIEAVIIALPLHLHAPVAIRCMEAGKHVLCEKLMAWNIDQCKQMNAKAQERGVVLSIGHQRHYSMLYAHANEVVQAGTLGDIHHIRALWHRNNTNPLTDKNDPRWNPDDPYALYKDSWRPGILDMDRNALGDVVALRNYGYRNIEELVRWRLYNRTGGGLMAELGSHQLDACSIFLGKVKPLSVSAIGGKYFYQDEREVQDHVFCTFEFPGKDYWAEAPTTANPNGRTKNTNDVIVVTYSSISTNSFEPYGECVMGRNGTLVVEQEQKAMLWGQAGRSTALRVRNANGLQPTLDSSASTGGSDRVAGARGAEAIAPAPSRGYREEMEHFAYVIRERERANEQDRQNLKPRCDGVTAMADAIMALATNQAIRSNERIVFDPRWYHPTNADRGNGLPPWDQPARGPQES